MPREKYMTRMQRLYLVDPALSGEADIDHCGTVQEEQYERPVHFLYSSDDSFLKQTFTLLGRTSALFKVFRCGPKRRFSFWCDGGPRWET